MDEIIEEASKKYQGLVPLVYDIETMGLDEARSEDMQYAVYLKREADKVIADLEESHKKEVGQLLMEIAELKEERRWRKFPDEKPTEDIKFLVINEKGMLQCCYYSPILKEFQIPVTHWMPLPSAPKEGK